jgi:hypothetical protein
MLCEKNLDLAMLKKMFGIQQHRRQGNRATKEIGEGGDAVHSCCKERVAYPVIDIGI